MKRIKLLLIIGLIVFGLIFSCGCTSSNKSGGAGNVVQETQSETVQESEVVEPIYSVGDVVAKDETGYMLILAVNDGYYTIRWTTQDPGESMPGHFEVSEPAKDQSFGIVHTLATGVYKQVDVSEIDEKNTAYYEQHYSEVVAESEAEVAAAAEVLENYEGGLPETYFEVSASHKWDALVYFDCSTSSKSGQERTKITVPEGTKFAQCILSIDFSDHINSGSDEDSSWVKVSLYGPNKELLKEEMSDAGISSRVHVTYFF